MPNGSARYGLFTLAFTSNTLGQGSDINAHPSSDIKEGGNLRLPVSALPVTVMDGTSPLADVAQVTVGSLFACARLRDGTARCWGTNASGQLGDDSKEPSSSPVIVMQ